MSSIKWKGFNDTPSPQSGSYTVLLVPILSGKGDVENRQNQG